MATVLPNAYNLNEDTVNSNNYKCGTECLFKFNFQEQSTSYTACMMDVSSVRNYLGLPSVRISNDFLSNTNNPGVIAVNFQNNNYWFDNIYITRPGNRLFDYTNSIYPPPGINASPIDASASSLLIVCKNNNGKSKLIVQQNVISRETPPSNSGGSVLSSIINSISNTEKSSGGSDASFNNVVCGGQNLVSLSSINVNNLIPTSRKFFYYEQKTNDITYYFIIFSALSPIIISETVNQNLNSFFATSSTTTSLSRITLPPSSSTSINRVFISSKNPINSLSDGEENIYIQCQPTDQEGNILVSGDSVAPQQDPFNLNDIMGDNKSMFTAAIMGIVIMIIIVKGGEFILKNGTRTFLGSL